jgi:hypothetical protein
LFFSPSILVGIARPVEGFLVGELERQYATRIDLLGRASLEKSSKSFASRAKSCSDSGNRCGKSS